MDKQVYEKLKSHMYRGDVEKFIYLFNTILRSGRDVVQDYMKGKHDNNRGLLFWAGFNRSFCNDFPDSNFEILKYILKKTDFDVNYKYKKSKTLLHLH